LVKLLPHSTKSLSTTNSRLNGMPPFSAVKYIGFHGDVCRGALLHCDEIYLSMRCCKDKRFLKDGLSTTDSG